MRGEQALFNFEIKKKSGSSINPDIHQSKVPSSWDFKWPRRLQGVFENFKQLSKIIALSIQC